MAYLESIVKAEGSHMMMETGSSILLRFDVATRRTALHEWMHRCLQRRAGTYRVNKDEFIESFLSRHAKFFRLDD